MFEKTLRGSCKSAWTNLVILRYFKVSLSYAELQMQRNYIAMIDSFIGGFLF